MFQNLVFNLNEVVKLNGCHAFVCETEQMLSMIVFHPQVVFEWPAKTEHSVYNGPANGPTNIRRSVPPSNCDFISIENTT